MRIQSAESIPREMFPRSFHPLLLHSLQKFSGSPNHLIWILPKTAAGQRIIDPRAFWRCVVEHGRQIQI